MTPYVPNMPFSSLMWTKTNLRNLTFETRLNVLAAFNINQDVSVMEDEAIDILASEKHQFDFSI